MEMKTEEELVTSRATWSRVAFGAAAAVTVTAAVTGNDRLQRIAKPLMVPALAFGIRRPSPVLATAMAAATLGDVLLLDPDDDSRILRGAGAFAVMQASYCALLVSDGRRFTAAAAVPRYAGWASAAALMFRRSPAVAPGLAGYGLLLATMSTLSADPMSESKTWAGVVVPGADPRSRLALGGILFTVSDALIVYRRLFLDADRARRLAEGVILATYALAQLFLVEGLDGEK